MRVDEGLSPLARDRHAMVAVLHEVRLADLVQIDRRQLQVVEVRAVDALPPVARLHLSRQERAVKVAIPTHASDDLVDRHLAQAAVALGLGMNAAADFVEGEESVVRSSEPAHDTAHEGSAPGAAVIGSGDVGAHHSSMVRAPYAFTTVVGPNWVCVTMRVSKTCVCPWT